MRLWRGVLFAVVIYALIGLVLMLAFGERPSWAAEVRYTPEDTLAAIHQASAEIGVDEGYMTRIVRCEDPSLDPYAVGDHGTSFGPVQLHRGGGALARFYAIGYDDVFSPWQSIRYLAQEISFGRAGQWSCA